MGEGPAESAGKSADRGVSVERLAGGEESAEGLENAGGSAGRLEGDNSGSGQGMAGGFFLGLPTLCFLDLEAGAVG